MSDWPWKPPPENPPPPRKLPRWVEWPLTGIGIGLDAMLGGVGLVVFGFLIIVGIGIWRLIG